MAVDKLVDSAQLDSDLTSVANAIRTKGGTSAQLVFPSGFVSAVEAIPTGGSSALQLELVGEKTFDLEEYTDTANIETIDTGINIYNTDYAYLITVITCDSPILTSSEWGMTIAFGGRYTTNSNYLNRANGGQKGSSTLSKSGMVNSTSDWSSYGVTVVSNTSTIIFNRKAHGLACPKIRGGTYTVSVYGLVGI